MTCFKGLAKYFLRPCKNTLREFRKQNSQEAGALRRPWRQRESFGLVLGMWLLGIGAARWGLDKNWTQEHST